MRPREANRRGAVGGWLLGRSLDGQVALVTGASSGVGWQTAGALGDAGMKVCVTARRQEEVERLQRSLEARGVEALAVAGDVTRADDVERVVSRCVDRFGRLDLLVNVPSVQLFAPFEGYRWDEIARVVDVNFYGYLRLARAALPWFRRQGSGHILNVGSVFSEMGFPLFSIYAATKHAVLGWADALRLELHGSGIEVSTVLLPTVATPFYDVAPTRLGKEPRPPPPVYSPAFAARAIVRCARRPRARSVPALLQGKLALAGRRLFPAPVDFVLARWGASLVTGARAVERGDGNLFAPPEDIAGADGTARATPAWLRLGMDAAVLGAVAGVAGALIWAARRATRHERARSPDGQGAPPRDIQQDDALGLGALVP